MEWEAIVNQHSREEKTTEQRTRKNKYLRNAVIPAAVAVAFIVATVLKLVHPYLSELVMMTCLLIAFFNFGRAKECVENA